jgi:hypothetical protein
MVEEKPGHFFDATKSKRNPQQQQQQQQPYIPFTKIREKVFNLGLTNGGNDGENKFKYFGTNGKGQILLAIVIIPPFQPFVNIFKRLWRMLWTTTRMPAVLVEMAFWRIKAGLPFSQSAYPSSILSQLFIIPPFHV